MATFIVRLSVLRRIMNQRWKCPYEPAVMVICNSTTGSYLKPAMIQTFTTSSSFRRPQWPLTHERAMRVDHLLFEFSRRWLGVEDDHICSSEYASTHTLVLKHTYRGSVDAIFWHASRWTMEWRKVADLEDISVSDMKIGQWCRCRWGFL